MGKNHSAWKALKAERDELIKLIDEQVELVRSQLATYEMSKARLESLRTRKQEVNDIMNYVEALP